MRVIITLDDALGRTLFGKRLSKDRIVNSDIISSYGSIFASEYTAAMFLGSAEVTLLPDIIPPGSTLFLEREEIPSNATELVVYKWNRKYPSDVKYDPSSNGWKLTSSSDFPGYSHQKITKEVYTK